MQAWVPAERVFFAANTPAWSLSCEIAFYTAFPLLLRIIRKYREDRLWLLAGGLVILIMLVPAVASPLPKATAYSLVSVFPVTRGLEFTLGMVLARIVLSGRWIRVGLRAASGFFLVCYLTSSYLPGEFSYVAGTIVPIALLIPPAAVADIAGRLSPWRNRTFIFPRGNILRLLPAASTCHSLTYKVFGSPAMSALHALALGVGMFAVALVGSCALYWTVERPMMQVLGPQRRVAVDMG